MSKTYSPRQIERIQNINETINMLEARRNATYGSLRKIVNSEIERWKTTLQFISEQRDS